MDATAQRVQLQLKAAEKADKADESPVTIADYGNISRQTMDAILHISMIVCPLLRIHAGRADFRIMATSSRL
jgi:hypothetical protein